jgi:hypothetical protein
MDQLRTSLKPLTDWIPTGVRDGMPVEAWWGIFAAVGLLVLFIFFRFLRLLFRGGSRRKPRRDWVQRLNIDLAQCPMPTKPPQDHVLAVYHMPVRVRLVVIAPAGKEVKVDRDAVVPLLDRVVPGLGAIIRHDRPEIVVWPPQLSHHGFENTFHRCTPIPRSPGSPAPPDEDPPSRWILVAGNAHVVHSIVLIGLGLWAEETNTIGRVNVEPPRQWLDVLRIQKVGE